MKRMIVALCVGFCVCLGFAPGGQWNPPAGYYDTATGSGAVLKNQLATIMSSGHIQRTYGDFRYAAAIYDQDPSRTSNLLLCYNGASVRSAWNNGTTWNREHVWPQSLQPGSAGNSTKGNLGDPHSLRPCNPTINSNRGNDPFSGADLTGSYRAITGDYYFPGDLDKGNIARSLFYSSVRYGLTLVNGSPSNNQMGDLAALLRWHYMDPPDEFERRRNHVIYSRDDCPSYYTNNRNAFVDRPEFVWSVFGGDDNDTLLYVGSGYNADGSSFVDIDLGAIGLNSQRTFADVQVTLHKTGDDGTYYAVILSDNAVCRTSTQSRAFDYGDHSVTLSLNIQDIPSQAGRYVETVTIDNLDVCGNSTAGRGSQDDNDVIRISYTVLAADITDDGHVNVEDLRQLAENWNQIAPAVNIIDGPHDEPGFINLNDLAVLASEWGI